MNLVQRKVALLGVGFFAMFITAPNLFSEMIEGRYLGPDEIESITVIGEFIEMKIQTSRGTEGELASRRFKYHVSSEGKVRFQASSNDPVFVFDVLRYDWFWDGQCILRKLPESDEEARFCIKAEK